MKRFFKIILPLLFIYSCSADTKKQMTGKEKQNLNYEIADIDLADQKEKISLLAAVKKVPYDTLYLILEDYYAKTFDYTYLEDSIAFVSDETISSISKAYHLSKSKVASIVFSIKYETQIDELENKAQDTEEPGEVDPRY
jgi:hypothetical protein